MRFARLAGLGLALFGSLAACTSVIQLDEEDDGSVCGPKPPTGGYCPPAWQCIDGDWVDTAGACPDPDPDCPASEPAPGGSCQSIGQECKYTVEQPCGPVTEQVYECTATGWQTIYPACQPEPTCPLEMPVVGSDCSGWEYPYFCQYNVSCNDELGSVTMSCDYSDPPIWKLDSAPKECACDAISDAALCSATATCQWLVPGCGDGILPFVVEGCYPLGDCQYDGCGAGEGCALYQYDPCWNSDCDQCTGTIGVCEQLDG